MMRCEKNQYGKQEGGVGGPSGGRIVGKMGVFWTKKWNGWTKVPFLEVLVWYGRGYVVRWGGGCDVELKPILIKVGVLREMGSGS